MPDVHVGDDVCYLAMELRVAATVDAERLWHPAFEDRGFTVDLGRQVCAYDEDAEGVLAAEVARMLASVHERSEEVGVAEISAPEWGCFDWHV